MERPYKVLIMKMWFINLKSALTQETGFVGEYFTIGDIIKTRFLSQG
ncbi:MAG: hypothetical protein QNJ68_15595 [Microcoleaceae cyanobacterium MO_207.B10]|nr:hypothetical protein [Microcoleaceae cyanobacterium MO_207.B10]